MRQILFVAFTLLTLSSYSQIRSYNDLGILFSKNNNRGTARFNGLSGAFGALGGDISSTSINPAGAAIAKKSSFSATLNINNSNNTSNYYGNRFDTKNDNTDISQAGAILTFDSAYNSKWNRFALFFNYNIENVFFNSYKAEGFSFPLFDEHFSDSTTDGQFDRNLYQYISNETNGENKAYTIGFSSTHQEKLFIGASLKINNLEFSEISIYEEDNDDIDGNILNVENYTENYINSTGVSLNIGFIYKLNNNIRLGFAYQTPTWHQEVIQEYYDEQYFGKIENLQINSYLQTNSNVFEFNYKSASEITTSFAYVFGKKGLISIDYNLKNYKNIKFESNNFFNENKSFNSDYRNTYSLRIGTEWRLKKVSIRGGANYEKNPNLVTGGNTNDDNIKSFSLGLGYNFENSQFDLSYTNSKNTDFYTISSIDDLNIDNTIHQISGTFTWYL